MIRRKQSSVPLPTPCNCPWFEMMGFRWGEGDGDGDGDVGVGEAGLLWSQVDSIRAEADWMDHYPRPTSWPVGQARPGTRRSAYHLRIRKILAKAASIISCHPVYQPRLTFPADIRQFKHQRFTRPQNGFRDTRNVINSPLINELQINSNIFCV